MFNNSYIQRPSETAAAILAQEQHAPGVRVRMNPQSFRVEYIRPDGSYVPSYEYFYSAAVEGRVKHDTNGRLIVITQ